MDPKQSFTAADAIPVKLLQNSDVIRSITQDGIIPPVHVQFIPTNKCNLACTFCSCSEEDRSVDMSWLDMITMTSLLVPRMTKSVTITGGGEPLLYPWLGVLINSLADKGIKTGLVTNGLLLHEHADDGLFRHLTWCRISFGDDRKDNICTYLNNLLPAIQKNPNVDWAFSYVVSEFPEEEQIKELIRFADTNNCTHVRLVADLLCPEDIPMEELRIELDSFLRYIKVPVIFQDRKKPEQGKDCRICYLKPVITPDMKVYACCGAQYALAVPSRKFPEELCLGSAFDLPKIVQEQSMKPFEGAKHCVKCYYGDYNRVLGLLTSQLQHKEFV